MMGGGGVANIQPRAGKHMTERRHAVFRRSSVTLVRVLGVDDFDVRERKETPPSVHLPLPLTADVHPGYLDDVAHLRGDRQGALFRQT